MNDDYDDGTRDALKAMAARPWRGTCPLCQWTMWLTETEQEARKLITAHIETQHPRPEPQVWMDHEPAG